MGFALSNGQKARPPAFSFMTTAPTTGEAVRLDEKYRPRRLADLLGNGYIVHRLAQFTAAPHSHAWLFSGSTGVGKSSAAEVLANELGVHPTAGLWSIKSGDQDAAALEHLAQEFRHQPWGGGWRCVVVEEADWMARAPKVANLWLSILDHLPVRTVFVFTTNYADKFPDRFMDRCEHLPFSADADTLRQDAECLVAKVWHAETGRNDPPSIDKLGVVREGLLSFRAVIRAIEPAIRQHAYARAELAKATASASTWAEKMAVADRRRAAKMAVA